MNCKTNYQSKAKSLLSVFILTSVSTLPYTQADAAIIDIGHLSISSATLTFDVLGIPMTYTNIFSPTPKILLKKIMFPAQPMIEIKNITKIKMSTFAI